MKKTAFISDVFFTFSMASLVTLCLFRYLGLRLLPAVLLALLCGMLTAAAIFAWLQSKRKNNFLKKSDERQKQKLLLHLALLPPEQATAFFLAVFSEEEPKKSSEKCLQTQSNAYFPIFTVSPVATDKVVEVFRFQTDLPKTLLCAQIENDAQALCVKLGISVKKDEEIYCLVKTKNALPEKYLGDEKREDRRNVKLRLCFAKTNSRRFFSGGALILFTSLLTPFPYYYLIFGSILLVIAAFIRIFGYE